MPVAIPAPIVYGDNPGELAGHVQAAGQQIHTTADIATRTLVGDAQTLAGHARGGADELTSFAIAQATAIGDALLVTGHAEGGDDQVLAGAGSSAAALGDALTLSGHANAGNDTVEARSDIAAAAYGDAEFMTDHAVGGDDHVSARAAQSRASVYGDAEVMQDQTRGGHDTLGGLDHFSATLYGDAALLEDQARGGDDLLVGQSGIAPGELNYLYGDGAELAGKSRGGNDTLVSGENSRDLMWGDAATVSDSASTGRDLFRFGSDNGDDTIADFERGKDLIELSGLGVDEFDDLAGHIQTTADGVLIEFGDDRILVAGVSQLGAGDFLFS